MICEGDVVEDLYSWWFLAKCSKGRMGAVGRSWVEVARDSRYKGYKG